MTKSLQGWRFPYVVSAVNNDNKHDMTNTTYPISWAKTQHISCVADYARHIYENFQSTFADFLADEIYWKIAGGGRFDLAHMQKLWDVVRAQKRRLLAKWIAEQRSIAFNAAYEIAKKIEIL